MGLRRVHVRRPVGEADVDHRRQPAESRGQPGHQPRRAADPVQVHRPRRGHVPGRRIGGRRPFAAPPCEDGRDGARGNAGKALRVTSRGTRLRCDLPPVFKLPSQQGSDNLICRHPRSIEIYRFPVDLTVLFVVTLASIAWSLWIRRVTWRCRWKVAATLNIALQGCAVVLMSPAASATIGVALHDLTGKWNLQDYIGHDCYIVAASAIVYNALAGSPMTTPCRRRSNSTWSGRPRCVSRCCLPPSPSATEPGSTGRTSSTCPPTSGAPRLNRPAPCGTLIYLLVFGSRALLVLRKDPDRGASPTCTWSLRLVESLPA